MHAEKNRKKMRSCDNIAIKGSVLEEKVFEMIESNMFTLAIVGLVTTVISAFYYIRIIKVNVLLGTVLFVG